MELPKRSRGDEFAPAGEYPALRNRVRRAATGLAIPTVVVYAFDRRTRLMPYYFTSHRMAPASVRAIGAALVDSGLSQTRVVLQQWTPNFRPSEATINGQKLEMLLVSSMQIHAAKAYELIADAHRGGSDRPLIIAGGPKAIYEPWDVCGAGSEPRLAADVAVTGEEFVLMQLIEVLLSYRCRQGTMLEAFQRARKEGVIEAIPGLVYRQGDAADAPLVTTGIQQLVRDLDEAPHPVLGYSLLERPHRGRGLRVRPLPIGEVSRHSAVGSLVMSHGCKFNCDYCPIPAYNQRTYRHKSGDRLVDEMRQIHDQTGIRYFFGTDDNFFNNRQAVQSMFDSMCTAMIGSKPLHKVVSWGTEATEHDTWANRDLLPQARVSGLRAFWLGIEDMTATLIRKGQSVGKTADLFQLLNKVGINPMAMMMHHDGQPLYTRSGLYGLLNQARYLRKIGATGLQVTMLTPAVGTRSYEPTFEKGMVFDQVGGRHVDEWQFDGNHVVASDSKEPWRLQLNIIAAYASFYNPSTLIRAVLRRGNHLKISAAFNQLVGIYALTRSVLHWAGWAQRVARGPITRRRTPPGSDTKLTDVSRSAKSAPQGSPADEPSLVKLRIAS